MAVMPNAHEHQGELLSPTALIMLLLSPLLILGLCFIGRWYYRSRIALRAVNKWPEAEPQLQPTSIVLVETPNAKKAEPVVMDTSMFASPSLLQTPVAPPRPPPLDVLTRRILESPSVTPMIDERSIAAQAVEVDGEGLSTPQQIARRLAWIKHHVANSNLPAAYALGWNGAWRTHDGGTIRTQETPVASTNGVATLQAFTTPEQTFRV